MGGICWLHDHLVAAGEFALLAARKAEQRRAVVGQLHPILSAIRGDDDARIQALVDERSAAKKSRDFARADAIRDQLAAEGIALEDTPQGVRWKRA